MKMNPIRRYKRNQFEERKRKKEKRKEQEQERKKMQ